MIVASLAAALSPTAGGAAPIRHIELVSGSSVDHNPPLASGSGFVSADGRYVVFGSQLSDIVPGPSSGLGDVYRRDLTTGTTEILTRNAGGGPADGGSGALAVSSDGSLVLIRTQATNLIAGTRSSGVMLLDLDAGTIEQMPFRFGAAMSDDGTIIAGEVYEPDPTNSDFYFTQIWVHDRVADTMARISVNPISGDAGDRQSLAPVLSADGRFVAFESDATDLVAADENGQRDVFVYDLLTGTTELASRADDGSQLSVPASSPSLSADGRYLAFGADQAYRRDLLTDATVLVSATPSDGPANRTPGEVTMSADGSQVAFTTRSTDVVAPPIVPGDWIQLFVRDIEGGSTELVSIDRAGGISNGDSSHQSLSADGSVVVFTSSAADLALGDANRYEDVFVARPGTAPPAACDPGLPVHLGPFPDVGPAHRFCAAIDVALLRHITSGYPDGTFGPGTTLSRQAGTQWLRHRAGLFMPVFPTTTTFTDVQPGHPFRESIEWANDEGIAAGFDDGTFRPGATLSRQAMAVWLHRAAGSPAVPPGAPTFTDVGPSHPFADAIRWLADAGIAAGYPDESFRPTLPMTRQAAAAWLVAAPPPP